MKDLPEITEGEARRQDAHADVALQAALEEHELGSDEEHQRNDKRG